MGKGSLVLLIGMMRNGDISCDPEKIKALLESRVTRLYRHVVQYIFYDTNIGRKGSFDKALPSSYLFLTVSISGKIILSRIISLPIYFVGAFK